MISEHRPVIMGILNITPDSFYSGSRTENLKDALKMAVRMLEDGADIIDIGGESTRPGSLPVDASGQIQRIVPVIRELRAISSVDISVDTRVAAVAEAALDAGASIVNDISSLKNDKSMAGLISERDVPVVLMHMQGEPRTMQENPVYTNAVDDVRRELRLAAENAVNAGIRPERIILDPGIGFGKRLEDNLALIRNISVLKDEGFPVLVGLSRKSFLASIVGEGKNSPENRMAATLAAHAYCLSEGVDYLRVHDVKETVDLVKVWEALAWAS